MPHCTARAQTTDEDSFTTQEPTAISITAMPYIGRALTHRPDASDVDIDGFHMVFLIALGR